MDDGLRECFQETGRDHNLKPGSFSSRLEIEL